MPNSGQPPFATTAPFPALARPAELPARGAGSVGLFAVVVAVVLSVATANPWTTLAAVLSFSLIVLLLWRPGLPPSLLFICLMQWLQGALMVLHADVMGVELRTLSYARHIEEATFYTLGWVSAIAVGAWLAMRRISLADVATTHSVRFSFTRLLVVYVAATVALQIVARVLPAQARQIAEAFEGLRWVIVFAVFAQGWSMRNGAAIVLGVLAFEIGIGFLSFFSEFKTPLYVFAIAMMSSGYRPTFRQYVSLTAVFIITLYLGIVWSSIKMEYRDMLNGGRSVMTQEVVLSTEESIDAFLGLLGTLDAQQFEQGAEHLVKRIAYVEYFGFVLGYVPRVRAHEEGRIWLNAFAHVLMPRVLFPDKARLESDSVITTRYTGIDLGNNPGTSITIGVPAETYVDLGPVLMFIVPVFLGLAYGGVYRLFIIKRYAGVLAQGITVALHISFTSVGAASTKILGGYLSLLIITLLLWRFGWPGMARFLRAQVR